jgi:hypothetical protein
MTVLPPKEEGTLEPAAFRLPKSLIKELDEIAEESNWSKNQVVIHFLRWARDEYRKERAAEAAAKKEGRGGR